MFSECLSGFVVVRVAVAGFLLLVNSVQSQQKGDGKVNMCPPSFKALNPVPPFQALRVYIQHYKWLITHGGRFNSFSINNEK